jgi:hypothetical protein
MWLAWYETPLRVGQVRKGIPNRPLATSLSLARAGGILVPEEVKLRKDKFGIETTAFLRIAPFLFCDLRHERGTNSTQSLQVAKTTC